MSSTIFLPLPMAQMLSMSVFLILVMGYLTVKMSKHPQWLTDVAPY